jgi:hypothetical protein
LFLTMDFRRYPTKSATSKPLRNIVSSFIFTGEGNDN